VQFRVHQCMNFERCELLCIRHLLTSMCQSQLSSEEDVTHNSGLPSTTMLNFLKAVTTNLHGPPKLLLYWLHSGPNQLQSNPTRILRKPKPQFPHLHIVHMLTFCFISHTLISSVLRAQRVNIHGGTLCEAKTFHNFRGQLWLLCAGWRKGNSTDFHCERNFRLTEYHGWDCRLNFSHFCRPIIELVIALCHCWLWIKDWDESKILKYS